MALDLPEEVTSGLICMAGSQPMGRDLAGAPIGSLDGVGGARGGTSGGGVAQPGAHLRPFTPLGAALRALARAITS